MTLATTLSGLLADVDGPLAVRVGDAWLRADDAACHARTCVVEGGNEVHVAAADPETLAVAEALVRAAARVAEAEEELEGLYDELSTSYESLSSIYEIGSDPDLLVSPDRALATIVDRALSFEADLKACVWLVREERLVAAHWRGTERPETRAADEGLVGRVLREQRGVIVNGRGSAEPELAAAHRVAISPMMCRDRALGALQVWHEAPGEFDSRLMGLMTSLSSQAAMILEQDRLLQETVEAERLRQELAIGGDIQQVLLLGDTPQGVRGLDVGTVARPSRQVDGDFFGFFVHDEKAFDVLVGDVMGKGIPAALVGAAVKSQFLRFASTLLPGGERRALAEPEAIVEAVHREVSMELIGVERFVTASYARFDVARGEVTLVDCGHTDALHYHAATGEVEAHAHDAPGHTNLPLGMAHDTVYRQITRPVRVGDCLVFYSDGVTEAKDADGRMFGVSGLAAALRDARARPAQEIAAAIEREVRAFAADDGIGDDVTCIVVKVRTDALRVLEVPARTSELAAVRDFVDRTCDDVTLEAGELASVRLAVNEAASNVMRHAYPAGVEGALRIEGGVEDGALVFRLFDRGRPFDPGAVPPPILDGSESGGFGVYIMRKIMDEVRYARDAAGVNGLVLRKHLSQEGTGK